MQYLTKLIILILLDLEITITLSRNYIIPLAIPAPGGRNSRFHMMGPNKTLLWPKNLDMEPHTGSMDTHVSSIWIDLEPFWNLCLFVSWILKNPFREIMPY
jgi:hypothetical protein